MYTDGSKTNKIQQANTFSGHILEIKIFELDKTKDYPEGFKYSLIVVDPKTENKILMDNHKPKKHHYHINNRQYVYKFKGIDQLFDDFQNLVKKHLGVDL